MKEATRSNNINELATALASAQQEISNPKKDAKNPFFKSSYSDLPSVLNAVRGVLPKHGLSFSQPMEIIEGGVYLVTLLMHTSGQWLKSYTPIISKDPKDPQKFGSSITYMRRYSLQAIVGIVGDDDDDGNAANKPTLNGDDIVKKFLDKWSGIYGKEALVHFVKYKAVSLGINERVVINMYLKNDEGFKKEINAWLVTKPQDVRND